MAIDLTGISNVNEFYTDHYLAAILENDLKDLFKAWATAEKEQGATPPDRRLAALYRDYFRMHAALERVREPQAIMEAQRPFLAGFLDALGYQLTPTERPLDGDETTLPVLAGVNRDSGAPDLWVVETLCPVVEVQDPLDLRQTPRPDHTVYHFLLPDTGMANYNDKVVKQMANAQLDAMKKWRTQFCKPFEPHHIAILERLSARIDSLWQEHIADRRQLQDLTRDAWDVFGYAADSAPKALTTQEKDRLFNDRILSRIDANSSAYRRLKLVMDYWCALWFWPIEQAHMLPTREEFLEEALTKYPRLRMDYLTEFEEAEGIQNFLNGYQNYPKLRGIQTNLYKCFLPQAWDIGSLGGASGFLHPEGVYDDPKGGVLREAMYLRLHYHFQFTNELKLFADVDHHTKFSVNAYHNTPTATPCFSHIANLYITQTVDACYDHAGHGPVEGIKDDDNSWNVHGHRQRIVRADGEALNLFAELYDEPGTPSLQARLPAVHANEILSVLAKFSRQSRRLGDLKGAYYSTVMWDETGAQKNGIIRRDTRFPNDPREWILSGPHFYVGNPFNKTPRPVCTKNSDYDPLDLALLPDAYLPRINYAPACSPTTYHNRTPKVLWDGKPVTEFYRYSSREMLSQAGERTLIPLIMPKGVGHINTCIAYTFREHAYLLDFFTMAISLPIDFRVKSTGMGHANTTLLGQLPVLRSSILIRKLIHLRALSLTCLTAHYAALWEECWAPVFCEDAWAKAEPRLNNDHFRHLIPEWTRDCALRTDFERRQALVEIDVLAAMTLGLTCDELCAIYRIQFPVLRQNEADTWYDQHGRIVFTCSKGLPGVGLDRPQWENETHLDKLEAAGLRIEGIASSDFSTIKAMPHGTVTRTVIDDTIADYRYAYGTFRKNGIVYHCPCPDYPEPIEGPVERDITYIAPFTRCDREDDYRTVWQYFAERMQMEEGRTQAPV